MQKTTIIGNIGNAAVARQNGQNLFLSFTVAVNDKYTDKQGQKQENTTWYNCAYSVKNDVLAQYLTKGTQVYLEGRLKPKLYTDGRGQQSIDMAFYVNDLQLLNVRDQQE